MQNEGSRIRCIEGAKKVVVVVNLDELVIKFDALRKFLIKDLLWEKKIYGGRGR
jgi:hypothetical protein